MALRSDDVRTRIVSFGVSQSGDVLLRAGQVRWKPLVAGIRASRCQPRKTAFACSCDVSVSADRLSGPTVC